MRLSRSFTLRELLRSDTATKLGFDEQFNPPEEIISRLVDMSQECLQPIRDELSLPMKPTSGYRCKRVNDRIGSNDRSAHLYGYAVDVEGQDESAKVFVVRESCPHGEYIAVVDKTHPGGVEVAVNSAILLLAAFNLPFFDQVINEYPVDGVPSWVHIGHKRPNGEQRGQILLKERGKGYVLLTRDQLWNMLTS